MPMEAPVKEAADAGKDGADHAANDPDGTSNQTDDEAEKATRDAHPKGKSEYDQQDDNNGGSASRFHRFEFAEVIPKIVQ